MNRLESVVSLGFGVEWATQLQEQVRKQLGIVATTEKEQETPEPSSTAGLSMICRAALLDATVIAGTATLWPSLKFQKRGLASHRHLVD